MSKFKAGTVETNSSATIPPQAGMKYMPLGFLRSQENPNLAVLVTVYHIDKIKKF